MRTSLSPAARAVLTHPGVQRLTQELLARAGATRVGLYDFERAAPGHLFHEPCGYLHALHQDGQCPSEADARAAYGDR